MSLVPDYVKYSDGKWYKNSTFGVADKWFVCFDDNDPPELVVDAGLYSKATFLGAVSTELGDQTLLEQYGRRSVTMLGRSFPPHRNDFHKKMKRAHCVWVKVLKKPPIEFLLEHDGCFDERPRGDCVYLDFEGESR